MPEKISGTVKTHINTFIVAPRKGYTFLYCSNESQLNVFFDSLHVTHRRGRILEETHYYPFGLTMAGISSNAAGKAENRYKFNDGTELANKEFSDGSGLEIYETDFRTHDPQLGRFWQIDPLNEVFQEWSPYSYSFDNPVLLNDPLGLEPESEASKPSMHPTPRHVCNVCDLPKPCVSCAVGPPSSTPTPPIPVPPSSSSNRGTASSTTNENNGPPNQIIINNIPPAGGGNINHTWDRASDRRISQLDGGVQVPATNFINRVHDELGINLRIAQGFRTLQEQDDLFALGRTRAGAIVTRARGGESYHNFGLAIDVVIVNPNGTLNWNPVPPQVVQIALQEGFRWGGNWRGFPDRPHFQMTFGQTLQQLRARNGIHVNR